MQEVEDEEEEQEREQWRWFQMKIKLLRWVMFLFMDWLWEDDNTIWRGQAMFVFLAMQYVIEVKPIIIFTVYASFELQDWG